MAASTKVLSYSNLETVGAAYKGFNDTLASWSSDRIMSQQCGQTWLQTFSEANNFYNSGTQLPYMQLVTWNDYEEGTEIESGIDNCFPLSASLSGSTLQWSISGNENTVDHYNVYISADGQNLMALTQTEPGVHSADLCSFPIPAGNYQLFVQAVGKPTMANRMPAPVSYSPTCSGSGGSANSSFTASPSNVTITNVKSGQITVTAAPSLLANGSISLSCASLPANLTCEFSPATLSAASGTTTSSLTITAAASAKNLPQKKHGPVYASLVFPFGLAGFAFMGNSKNRRRLLALLLFCGLTAGTMLSSSCGSASSSTSTATGASTYTISVLGNSSSGQVSTQVVVSLQQSKPHPSGAETEGEVRRRLTQGLTPRASPATQPARRRRVRGRAGLPG